MTDNGTQRDIGRLEGKMEAMQGDIAEIKESQEKVHGTLAEISGHIERQKGGWKVAATMGTLAGGVAGIIAKLWPHS